MRIRVAQTRPVKGDIRRKRRQTTDVRTGDLLQRLTFIYLASYLLVGGLGLHVVPDLTLRLLLSNDSYGDVMPRLVGVFLRRRVV